MAKLGYRQFDIANGASLSEAEDLTLDGWVPVGIQMPSAWTAANLTYQVSHDGTTFNDYYDSAGTEITTTVAASRFIRLNPPDFSGIRHLKVRSGTTGIPVNQGAARIIYMVFREM